MLSTNQLLVKIVLSSGGTVTDAENRNKLLKDWLAALQVAS